MFAIGTTRTDWRYPPDADYIVLYRWQSFLRCAAINFNLSMNIQQIRTIRIKNFMITMFMALKVNYTF